jgi:hypothetical protein
VSVFANTREVSGRSTPNKTIAAFPDVCLSPPSPPAGPIPLPYPVTGMASDTTDGTGSVKIKGKEVGKKNGVKYSKVMGDEPATSGLGASVTSHKITGPLKFAAYSFDVFFEKGGAERFMDVTTQNHMNTPGTSPGFNVAGLNALAAVVGDPCAALQQANKDTFAAIADPANAPEATEADKAKLKSFAQSGTISHSVLDGCGPRTAQRGTSSGVVRRHDNSFSKPADSSEGNLMDHPEGEKNKKGKVKKRVKSKICPESGVSHPRGGMHAHSEPGILEQVDFAKCPGATLTMAIDWHQANPSNRKKPNLRDDACGNCKKVLAAACLCIDIVLCNKDGGTRDGCEEPEEER